MTLGVAAAAAYPAPFVSGGVANVAIVYGTGAGVSILDVSDAASPIQLDLQSKLRATSGSTTASTVEGEGYLFEKSSTKLHLGDAVTAILSTLDDGELPELLADGTYMDNDNDEFDYKQEISVSSNLQVTMFDDDDFEVDAPTVGIKVADGSELLNYSLEFTEDPLFNDLETSELPIMGKNYYVLDVNSANTTITLLDSAQGLILGEGETTTVVVGENTYTVTATYIGTDSAKFSVDGVTTNKLLEGGTQKLASGAYIGVKDILYTAKDSGTSQVELSIGKGKLILEDGKEVEMNEDTIDGLYVDITNSSSNTRLNSIVIRWTADDDVFIAGTSEPVLPGFGIIKLSFGGLVYPVEEAIVLKADGDDNLVLSNFPLATGVTETINLLYSNSTNFTIIGRDDNNRLATAGPGATLTFTKGIHDYFVISYKNGDDAESHLVRATNFDDATNLNPANNEVDFEYLTSSGWSILDSNVQASETVSAGSNADFVVATISNESSKTVTLTATGYNSFYKLYSKEGMQVTLPWMNRTTQAVNATCATTYGTLAEGQLGYNATITNITEPGSFACLSQPATYNVVFWEEDKDDAIAAGDWINVTVGLDGSSEVTISSYATSVEDATASEIGDSDVYKDFTYSALATEILDDRSGDHEKITLTYHGGEVKAQVFLLGIGATLTSGVGGTTQLGPVLVKDSEVSQVAAKNLIIVGGSCINSAAAALVGGTKCGAAWTAATGVGSGQFLIKKYSSGIEGNSFALLVAGYDAPDTVNAATYLKNKGVDTNIGGIGTSSTAALTSFA